MSSILDYMRNTEKIPSGVSKQTNNLPDTNCDHPKVLKLQQDSNMGRQIMQNMESVMKTLKRRNKHKKHRQKKACQAISQQQVDIDSDSKNGFENGGVVGEKAEKPLADIKETWLSARPNRRSTEQPKTPSTCDPDKKNAFQMMMLNESKSKLESPNATSNDENQEKNRSGGKRQKEQVKKRKAKEMPCALSGRIFKSIPLITNDNH